MTPGRPAARATADGGRDRFGCGNRARVRARRALAEICRVLRAGGLLPFAGHGRSPDAPVPRWQDRLTAAQKTRACAVFLPGRISADSRTRRRCVPGSAGSRSLSVRDGTDHFAIRRRPRSVHWLPIASSTRGFTTSQGAEPGQVIRAGPESSREKAQCGESAGSLDAAEAGSGPGQGARPRGPRPRTGCPLTHGHVPGGEAHSRCLEGCPGLLLVPVRTTDRGRRERLHAECSTPHIWVPPPCCPVCALLLR